MLGLKPRSIESATAQGDLRAVQSRYGFVPNLLSTTIRRRRDHRACVLLVGKWHDCGAVTC